MICSFQHKGLEQYFLQGDGKKLPADMLPRIRILLHALTTAEDINDLGLASYRLHPLKGDLKGYWAVTVRANWRIVFRFENRNAYNVDFVDYH